MVLAFAIALFAVSFFLTGFVYQRIGQQPSAFVTYIINVVLGMLLFFVSAFTMGTYFGSKERAKQAGAFGPIFEAMQKIATGDFSVRLENKFGDNPLMSTLTSSVNNMAVELSQLEAMRQEFISNVSHELQSPLTSIRGFAQALQNQHLSLEDRTHYLSIIETECTRLSRITENLLRLASLEAKQVKFEPKPYRLDKQIRNLILACEPQWTTKQIEMDVVLDEVYTTADEDLMSQVWINLLHNSIKFTPEGGKVCVELHRQNQNIQFKIADSGIGISEDDKDHIFERFYKVDKSRTRSNNGGSGLGLSIAQKIVDMHQGTIVVNSELGVGTTFLISLPAHSN
jgi:signal transduction histidine kinase